MVHSKKLRIFVSTVVTSILFTSFTFSASYSVTWGDTLYKISQLFNTSVTKLYTTNDLKSSIIYPGQVLEVPAATYTVSRGDTLYLISQKHGIPLYSLRKANKKWDNYLYIGQKLIIPTVYTPSKTKTVISYTPYELDLLARLIKAEADGQPYDAQVAVGAVVINRVDSSSFPNNINDVIHQVINGYYQFTPVKNGWIKNPATETAKKAANQALRGSDPSNGALFYFDDSATNTWLWSKPILARIGRMVYVE